MTEQVGAISLEINLINSAREHLVLARYAKQKAQFTRDMVKMGDLPQDRITLIRTQEALAKSNRLSAKAALYRLEIIAGTKYSRDGHCPWGAKDLKGSNFKAWPAYKQVFLSSPASVDRWSL